MQTKEYDKLFFENVMPIKLTEGRKVKIHMEGWGILTDYQLESVKINKNSSGTASSTATLKIGDRSGQITCIIKGTTIGLLFGLSRDEWKDIEDLCNSGEQLFYRDFKDGLSKNYRIKERLFYNFCMSTQEPNVVVAIFRRCVNLRNKDKTDAFLQILDLRECDDHILRLYARHLRSVICSLDSSSF